MPIVLPPISRRRFLAGSFATGLSLIAGRCVSFGGDAGIDPDRIALLSDPHIAADLKTVSRRVTMSDHLKQVSGEVLALDRKPAIAFVCGDLAFLDGQPGDYSQFIDLVKPMRQGGLPVHLALGNHDNRSNFWAAVPPEEASRIVESKHISVAETPRADWVVLDSLAKTNVVPGTLGEQQLAWLTKTLDARSTKTVIVMVHHNPVADGGKTPGLTDTKPLLDIVLPRKQVKAVVFGHTHHWEIKEIDGLHTVNLPAVAYPFASKDPTGWVDMRFADHLATLELRCIDPMHPKHGEKRELNWRA